MTEHDANRRGAGGWSIDRCGFGCVHLHLERTTVTFSVEEFAAFRRLIEFAAKEWGLDGQLAAAASTPAKPH